MKEPVLLLAVNAITGRVEVEGDFLQWLLEGIEEWLDQNGRELDQRGSSDAILESAERGGRGQRLVFLDRTIRHGL